MKIRRSHLKKIIAEEIATIKKDVIDKTVMDVLSDEGGAAGLEQIKDELEDLEDDEVTLPDDDIEDIIASVTGVKRHADGDYVDSTQLESFSRGRRNNVTKISKRQLKRIIREEKARLTRRGLIRENYLSGGAEFSSRAMDMGYESHFALSKIYQKLEDCDMRMMPPEECAALLTPQEKALFLDEFMNVLVECQHPECQEILNYSYEVESYI